MEKDSGEIFDDHVTGATRKPHHFPKGNMTPSLHSLDKYLESSFLEQALVQWCEQNTHVLLPEMHYPVGAAQT